MKLYKVVNIHVISLIVFILFFNCFLLAFFNLSYSQALQGIIIDQPVRPAGVSTDLDGNLFVISDATYTTLLTRYGVDNTRQYVTLGGIDPAL